MNDDITLDSVIETPVEELNDEQKSFLQEHSEELNDEQKETYKDIITKEEKEEEEEKIDPDKIEPEVRSKEEKKEEEEEDVDPEDEKHISKIIDKKVKPLEDQIEVDSFLRVRPEFTKYREVMIKYVGHPAYRNIPVDNIAAIVASKDMLAMGAKKEREAQKKVEETKGNGGTVRKPTMGKTDWSKVSSEEFAAQRAKVLGQG